eukprot:PRCOL_00005119-RA
MRVQMRFLGPPDVVVEAGTWIHACEGESVCKMTNAKVPHFNAPIYLENKTQVGKVDEIFGPITDRYFTIKMSEGVVATSYSVGDNETGTCRRLAEALVALAAERGLRARAAAADGVEPERLAGFAGEHALALVCPTYAGGAPPKNMAWFCRWLEEAAIDERVSGDLLSGVWASVFAVGDLTYGGDFCAAGKALAAHLAALGARPLAPRGTGDASGESGDMEEAFGRWGRRVADVVAGRRPAPRGGGPRRPVEAAAAAAPEGDEDGDDAEADEEDAEAGADDQGLTDLEDLGKGARAAASGGAKQIMVTPLVRKSLTKQGYKVVGSHSGVKLCRWTKSMLRGRGGCYKHAFYGIASHRCMETTPSLACSSKCTFCWRHHSNPVGRSWKWEMDPPDELVAGVLEQHRRMIREFGGVPGVQPQRLKEGLEVKHCALSLVGEPIMYPEINAFVGDLHRRGISSFLVNNAQHPDQLANLVPVTQLYVSVDAATKEELKAIDRPIFGDFWERMLRCLEIIRDKRQRTVFRLTLVKGYNAADVSAYARLVEIGRPDMIEIKGVTYCGSSGASDLSMKNVPYHEEVKRFAEALCEECGCLTYGMACEHAHSCCVLVASREKFFKAGRWHTWIDYQRFQELVAAGGTDFGAEDYMLETPDWAVYNSEEAGFAPGETRFKKVRRHNKSKAGPPGTGAAAIEVGAEAAQSEGLAAAAS